MTLPASAFLRRALLAAPALLPAAAAAREVADATGRRVALPGRVARVLPAGPPAAVLAYTLAPELLAGWPARTPEAAQAAFLDPAAAALPAVPRLAGRDAPAEPDALRAARPDLVLDYGSVSGAFLDLAERVTARAGVPSVLLDGALGKIPETYLQLGDMLGRPQAAEERAGIADIILLSARQAAARLQARGRPRVLHLRGPRGTQGGPRGAAEVLHVAGAEAMAAPAAPEQLRDWDPDWIIARDPAFLRHAASDPAWRGMRAVRQGRLVLAPRLPFGWLDGPPSVNRLLGLMWLPVLFGVVPAETLPPRIEAFHATFYHRRPTAAQVAGLLASALPPP